MGAAAGAPPHRRRPERARLRGACHVASRPDQPHQPRPPDVALARAPRPAPRGRPVPPARQPGREALARRGFPYEDVTPADYVAEHGADMTGFTYDDESYADADLDAWIVEVGSAARAARGVAKPTSAKPEPPRPRPATEGRRLPSRRPMPSRRQPPSHAPNPRPSQDRCLRPRPGHAAW